MQEFTSIEKPFVVYEVEGDRVLHDTEAPGILFHAVDHLPSECPRDASEHFGSCLLPLLRELAFSDGSKPFAEQTDLPAELQGAVVCDHGALTPSECRLLRGLTCGGVRPPLPLLLFGGAQRPSQHPPASPSPPVSAPPLPTPPRCPLPPTRRL
jgi:hypothetical protein